MGNTLSCKKKAKESGNHVVPIRNTAARRVPRIAAGTSGRSTAAPPTSSKRNNYVVLEDQLVDLDDPSSANLGVLEARRNSCAPPRPITATTMIRRAKTALAREKRSGLTLEFSPHDSTLLQIEGVGDRITRITKMVVVIEDKIRETKDYALHKGTRDSSPVCVYVVRLGEATYEAAKREIVARDQAEMKDPLTSHPRFVRYLGTCFNPSKLEAYVITDYAVGCTLEDIMKNPEVREAMGMTEEGKVRAAADLADAVYFLHGHSRPVAHGAIGTANAVVDGETHRGKLVARQGAERILQLVTLKGTSGFSDISDSKFSQERSPEQLLSNGGGGGDSPAVSSSTLSDNSQNASSSVKSDIWSLGATVLQFLFDQPVWDLYSLAKQFNLADPAEAVRQVLDVCQ